MGINQQFFAIRDTKAGGGSAAGGLVLGQGFIEISALVSGSTAIPDDDTIPQSTEGFEIFNLVYTPVSVTSKLKIEADIFYSPAGATGVVLALFKNSETGAIAAKAKAGVSGDSDGNGLIHYIDPIGSLDPITFRIRIGANAGFTISVNGNAGARRLGGVAATSLTVTEYSQ